MHSANIGMGKSERHACKHHEKGEALQQNIPKENENKANCVEYMINMFEWNGVEFSLCVQ